MNFNDLIIQVAESLNETRKKLDKENKKKTNRIDENYTAKLIAAVVRNKMEDFHCKYLSDEQMKELNPIIRNAIYTALIYMKENPTAMLGYSIMYVPKYWEDCELLKL